MRPRDVEIWALNILEQIESSGSFEDALVELKADWPEPAKMARRLAGHANSARGNSILWLIGVDEKKGAVGSSPMDLASFRQQIEAEFDHVAPDLTDVVVDWNGARVHALGFETDRAPFVIRNPAFGKKGGGAARLEVPWRQGTSVESASRSQLLLLLSPTVKLPEIELLEAQLALAQTNNLVDWNLSMLVYITPRSPERIAIAAHRVTPTHQIVGSSTVVTYSGDLVFLPMGSYSGQLKVFTKAPDLHPTIRSTNYDLTIDGPGLVKINATTRATDETITAREIDRIATMKIQPAGADLSISLSARLAFAPTESIRERWFYSR